MTQYLNWKQVQVLTGGKSRSTIWRWEKTGIFPRRRQLGPNSVAWLESDIQSWMHKCAEAR